MGKGFAFIAFMWLVVTIAAAVLEGGVSMATTTLTVAMDDDYDTALVVQVVSTTGFPDTGIIIIEQEKIAYADTTANTFTNTLAMPTVRGVEGTEAVAHPVGARVRTRESSMMNSSANYNIAVIADASGLWAAIAVPLAVIRLIGSYLVLPTTFLGTDLAIIGYVWWAIVAGMIISIGIALAGARRV